MRHVKTIAATLLALALLTATPKSGLTPLAQANTADALSSHSDPGPLPTVAQANLATARALGQIQVLSGPAPCRQEDCYELEVRCPQVAEPERATLKVSGPSNGQVRGTIMLMTGGGGTGLWEGFGLDARRVLGELREAGFRTVQLQWARGWLVGADEALEGQARLACRPATVARWVYDHLNVQTPTPVFCVTGNSGGAAQVSYMLAQYGLADILSVVIPSGGPPMGRIDLGCIRDDPANQALWYEQGSAGTIDRGFGVSSNGPCARGDVAFREQFQEASVAFGNWQYVYPHTMVWFLFGENDSSNAVAQGKAYYERVLQEGSPLVEMGTVPGTPHAVPSTRQGAEKIRDILLAECRAQ